MTLVLALLCLWLTWCTFNLVCMVVVQPTQPSFTGFRIVIPEWVTEVLTGEELIAVEAHELGHKHHRHVW